MVETKKISELTLLENNPRQISKENFEKLKLSLQRDPTFLKMRPVLAYPQNGQLIVYAGNQRVRAAQDLGWVEVPAIIDEEANLEQIRQRILLDNVEFGEWDKDILANNWDIEELQELDLPEIGDMITSLELEPDYSNKNTEITTNALGNESTLSFKFAHQQYLEILARLNNAKESLECDTNEDTLIKLLGKYE